MKPIIAAPIVALAFAGLGTGTYFLATSGGGEEEAVVAQPTPTPTAEATAAPTPTPSPAPEPTATPGDWSLYADPELGFSFERPNNWALSEESVEYPPKNGHPAVEVRLLSFRTAKGEFALGLALAPNPGGLSLADWVSTYPGWPGEPSNLIVDGRDALLFPIDQLGEHFPQIYFEHEGVVYTVQLNVYGHQGKPPGMSEEDMQRLIDGFRLRR